MSIFIRTFNDLKIGEKMRRLWLDKSRIKTFR